MKVERELDERQIRLIYDGEHPDYVLVTEDEEWICLEKTKIYKCKSDGTYWKMFLWTDSNDIIRRDRKLCRVVEKIVTHKIWSEDIE